MIEQQGEIENDFYQKFLSFYQQTKDITNVRFNYMRELYNLGIDAFPDDAEVLNIQQNNKLNQQTQQSKLKKNWTDEDKKVLIWLVGKMAAKFKRDLKLISESDWTTIASLMPRRDGFKCKQKWLQMLKLPLQQAPWTITEDELVKSIIQDFQNQNKGNKWSQIATTFNKIRDTNVHRNGKQCRERWNNHLNPTINRNPWQLNEDLDLMKLAINNGKKWALISKKLLGTRSENSVKNRFNCLLRKEKSQKPEEKDESAQDQEQSRESNFPSVEELSHDELKLIHAIMKKIEWRIQQSGNHRCIESDEAVKEEHQELLKKVKIENQIPTKKEFRQKLQSLKSMDNISLQVQENASNTDEDLANLLPCLIYKEKNIIYLATPEQLQIYLNKTSETSQLGTHQDNLSNQNSMGSFIYDPKLFRSYMMFQSNEYPQVQSGIYNQRSILNPNTNLGNFQSINSYPYQMNMSCYQSQMNLMNQLQR